MKFKPDIHHRRSIRLKGYNYARSGSYFVTICTHNRECLFGRTIDGEMQINGAGELVQSTWAGLPARFPNIEIDSSVVMPNHFHGIIGIVGAPLGAPPIVDPIEKQGAASSAP